MTAVVGVLCSDGVVVGTDSSATFSAGQRVKTIEQQTEKIDIIGNCVILAGTGEIGFGQRFCEIIKQYWDKKEFSRPPIETGKILSRSMIEDLGFTHVSQGERYGALVAFQIERKPYLCEFAVNDFQPELKNEKIWYVSMGSGQTITDPFLGFMREVFWDKGPPTVQEAIFAVTWTLDHVISLNPGGVNCPVKIAILEKGKKGHLEARMLPDSELGQHRQMVEEAKNYLKAFPKIFQADSQSDLPQVPTA